MVLDLKSSPVWAIRCTLSWNKMVWFFSGLSSAVSNLATLPVQALADPYFKGLAKVDREPSAQPITKMEFEFERRRINKEDVRELIYREACQETVHPVFCNCKRECRIS
jgi:hypothetical protein